MKILVFPDIHQKTDLARKIFEKLSPQVDKVVFLGDFFDSYGDTVYQAAMIAEFVKDIIHNPKVVCLFGNHDISYRFNNGTSYCPGYSQQKSFAIRDRLSEAEWGRFKYFHQEDGVVYSHAGFCNKVLIKHDILWNNRNLQNVADETDASYRHNEPSFYTAVDYQRGGNSDFGGVLWCDWKYLSLNPAFSQVVGHTPQFYPKVRRLVKGTKIFEDVCLRHDKEHATKIFNFKDGVWNLPKNFNLAVDCHLSFVAILEDGKKLTIIDTKEL